MFSALRQLLEPSLWQELKTKAKVIEIEVDDDELKVPVDRPFVQSAIIKVST